MINHIKSFRCIQKTRSSPKILTLKKTIETVTLFIYCSDLQNGNVPDMKHNKKYCWHYKLNSNQWHTLNIHPEVSAYQKMIQL